MGYNENCYNHLRESRKQARKYGGWTEQDIWRTTSVYVDRNTGEIIEQRRLENGEYIKLKKQLIMELMEDTKVKQLQPNAKKTNEESLSEELIKRKQITDSPFEVITRDGYSFGVMGNYRLTEQNYSKNQVKEVSEELEKITWNRVVQVIMILDEIKDKLKKKEIVKTLDKTEKI